MGKKIVLINQVTGYLFIDVVNAFAKEYEDVVLMAGEVLPMNIELDVKVKVQKIYRYNRQSTIKRFMSWVVCLFNISWLLFFKYRRYDLLISSNPPIASTILPILFRRRTNLLIYDVYPDGLVAGNFVNKNNLIFKYWAKLNRLANKKVEKIITLTRGMAKAMEAYSDAGKIEVVPAWAATTNQPMNIPENQNLFIERYGLQGKFIVMYSGNFGKEYELESLIYLAAEFKDNKNIIFIIMGKGWKMELLEKLKADRHLHNCMILPYQPAELFVHSLNAFHVGVVTLAASVANVAIPSKTYNLLASHRPVFCIGDEDSDLAVFLQHHEIGVAIEARKTEKMKIFIEKVFNDKKYFDTLCSNASLVAQNYTKDRAKDIVALTN